LTHYRPPPWRIADDAWCYVNAKLREDAEFALSVAILEDASNDPVLKELQLLPFELGSVVEMARRLHAKLARERRRLKQAREAEAAARLLMNECWRHNGEIAVEPHPLLIADADRAALRRVAAAFAGRARVAADAARLVGATRQSGGSDPHKQDRAALRFAIGAFAFWVKRCWGQSNETLVRRIVVRLFGLDDADLDTKAIAAYRAAHAKLVREGGAVVRWDMLDASWPPAGARSLSSFS
jgi:hypothetical protein